MRALTLTRQYLRVLKLVTEVAPSTAGYTRSDLRRLDEVCRLADESMGAYEAAITTAVDAASDECRAARASAVDARAAEFAERQICDRRDAAVARLDETLGAEDVDVHLDDATFDWWYQNWQSRAGFAGQGALRRAVFAIDRAFESAAHLRVQGDRLVRADAPRAAD